MGCWRKWDDEFIAPATSLPPGSWLHRTDWCWFLVYRLARNIMCVLWETWWANQIAWSNIHFSEWMEGEERREWSVLSQFLKSQCFFTRCVCVSVVCVCVWVWCVCASVCVWVWCVCVSVVYVCECVKSFLYLRIGFVCEEILWETPCDMWKVVGSELGTGHFPNVSHVFI